MKISSKELNKTTSKPRTKTLDVIISSILVFITAFFAGAFMYQQRYFQTLDILLDKGPLAVVHNSWFGDAADSIIDEVRLYENNGLPTLELDVKFEDYQTLLAKRSEALEIGILNSSDADYVDGKVTFNHGEKLDAELRLKGDWTDHLEGDKWSFKIKLQEEGQVYNMREFSIQSPATRNFLNEWAFHRSLMDEGVLTTRYEFVNVTLNGENLGVYALEDSFTPELMESQERRQGVIIRFNEDLLWDKRIKFWSQDVHHEGTFMVVDSRTSETLPFKESKIAADPVLSAEAQKARELLYSYQKGDLPASQVFDVDLMGKFFALSDLWSACHGTIWHNLRFYYNPISGLLEPVAYDSMPFMGCLQDRSVIPEIINNSQFIFQDEEIRAAYARELERLSRPESIAALKKELAEEEALFTKAMRTEFYADEVGVNWSQLKIRGKVLQLELQPSQPVRGTYQLSQMEAGSPLTVDVLNLMLLPVEVERVEVNGVQAVLPNGAVHLSPILDPAQSSQTSVRLNLRLPQDLELAEGELPEVVAVARLDGLEEEVRVVLSGTAMPDEVRMGAAPQQPTIDEVLRQHPFLTYNPAQRQLLVVQSGVWDVQGDLILPEDTDLFVEAGTVLRFGAGSILYATGSVRFLGEEGAPVVLTAQGDTWGGIVIANTERDSYWQYAVVEKTGGISRDGWVLTGGITFYKATLQTEHAVLGNNLTEDAINIVHGSFSFRNSEFLNTYADALDTDFSTGEVLSCYFHDIAGDAVDVSGTKAVVKDTQMKDITDKGVSVGENSHITVENVQMDGVVLSLESVAEQ